MVNPQYKIAAYWGPRADTPEALAFRLLDLLNQLKTIDPVFANWYLFTSETEVEPFDMNPASLTKTIAQAIGMTTTAMPNGTMVIIMAHLVTTRSNQMLAASR